MKILIADDSAFMRAILKDIVSKSTLKDAEIFEAGDGEEALNIITTQKPDLLLLDIIMPKKDGIAVLKEAGHDVPTVIIVSSVGQSDIIEQAKSLGAKDYIVKPFDSKMVTNVLNALQAVTK